MRKEAHIFIVWQSGFKYLSRILWDLFQNFEIKYVEKIVWNKKEILKNLKKIYPNRNSNELSSKIREIGGNELFFIVVLDKNPLIQDNINLNVFSYKKNQRAKERKKAYLNKIFGKKGRVINYMHASDSEKEAFLNYKALTNKSKKDFYNIINSTKDVCYIVQEHNNVFMIKEIERKEFKNLFDVFGLLNKHIKYVVLRNWEYFFKDKILKEHGDIDILTEDYYNTLLLLRAQKVFKEDYRVHFLIEVGKSFIPFDIRYVGDKYYDTKWEKLFLDNRIFEERFYRINNEDYFWSLLYHAIFHKRKISEEYKKKLTLLGNKIGKSSLILENFKFSKKYLKKYLRKNHIKITRPKDKSVIVFKNAVEKLQYRFCFLLRIITNLLFKKSGDLNYIYNENLIKKLGIDLNLKKIKRIKNGVFDLGNVILKIADKDRKFLLKNEAKILMKLKNYEYFPKVLAFFCEGGKSYLLLKKIKGKCLCKKLKIAKKNRENFIKHLDNIVKILKKENIVHRDIRPHNLIITEKGFPYLIDFEFAIFNQQEVETNNNVEKYLLITYKKRLGGRWRVKDAPIDKMDNISANIVKKEYCYKISFSRFCKDYLRFLIDKNR